MSEKNYLIIIAGATAVGKTSISIDLARHFDAEILSCDSRQFFRETNIATAKPSPKELSLVKHHFINELSIHQSYSVGDFERDGLQLLEQLFKKNKLVLLTGGSGLYIRALCEGLDHFPAVPPKVLEEVKQWHQKKGLKFLQEKLKSLDPKYFQKVDLQNPHRLIRALSVCLASGQPYSSFREKTKKNPRNFIPVYILLTRNRDELYQRINLRVDEMIKNGLIEEAKQLLPFRQLNALQTLGYSELFDYLDGKTSLEEAVELIKRNTRRFAKRQITWFRRKSHWKHFHPDKFDMIQSYIEQVTLGLR